MAALDKQVAEIPLAVTMATKPNVDMQDVSSMRSVENLRFDGQGELKKRPTFDDNIELAAPWGYTYASSTPVAEAMFPHYGEACVLTEHNGVARAAEGSGYAQYVYGETQVDNGAYPTIGYSPRACSVTRRFVHSAQSGKVSSAITMTSSACYAAGDAFVVAWYEPNAAGTGRLLFRAYDISTGSQLAPTFETADQPFCMSSIEYKESGKEGVLVADTVTGAPYSIKTVRWDHGTKAFVSDSTLRTGVGSIHFAMAPDTAGTKFYLHFLDNGTGFTKAQYRTVGAVTSTHAGTVAATWFAIVVGATATLLIHNNGTLVRCEKYGTPATVHTTMTASTETYLRVAACAEGDDVAVIAVTALNGAAVPPTPLSWRTSWSRVTFSGAMATPDAGHVPNAWHTGAAVTVGKRAYHVFALAGDGALSVSSNIQPTSLVMARLQVLPSGPRPNMWTPVARICHDRYAIPDYLSLFEGGNPAALANGVVHMALTADFSADVAPGATNKQAQTLFWERIDFSTPPTSETLDGVTMVSTAAMFEYDGNRVYETQPLNRPYVALVDDGAGTTTIVTHMKVVAVYRAVDGAGRLHRSAPSDVSTMTARANKKIDAYVTVPSFSSWDGVASSSLTMLEPELYGTTDGGSTYYLLNYGTAIDVYDSTDAKSVWYIFSDIKFGTSANPQLYSDGSATAELVSEPPPAFCSIVRIGDRVWAIDAEDRTRIWYSKPLVAGYAVEWNTANTLTVGDECVAVCDANGVPTVLAKHGIWQVYGDGPNALGVGSFAPARRLPHEVECVSALSVCRTPAGVVFRGRRGLYLLGGDLQPLGLPIDPSMLQTYDASDYTRCIYIEQTNEVRVIEPATGYFVYNLVEQKWSKWTNASTLDGFGTAAYDACVANGRVWHLHYQSNTTTYYLRREYGPDETSTYSTSTEGWTIQTPWISLGGVSGASRLWRAYLTMRLASTPTAVSSLQITVDTRGRSNSTHTYTWSGSDLDALGGSGDVVDLQCYISEQRAKSYRFTITETPSSTYNGSVPLTLRLEYGAEPTNRQGKSAHLKGGAVSS